MLRHAGHAVTTAREFGLDQATDAEILQHMARSGLVIVTADSDFARLHETRRLDHAGILLLPQVAGPKTAVIVAALTDLLRTEPPLVDELYAWSAAKGWVR